MAVLVKRKQRNSSTAHFNICDCACDPRCHNGHHRNKVSAKNYEIVEDAPFRLCYKRNNFQGTSELLPVIPIGKAGDKILTEVIVKFMKDVTVTDAVKMDKWQVFAFVHHRFYFFHDAERITNLWVKVLGHDQLTTPDKKEMFALREISNENAKEIRGCAESIRNFGEIMKSAMNTQQTFIQQLAVTSQEHTNRLDDHDNQLAALSKQSKDHESKDLVLADKVRKLEAAVLALQQSAKKPRSSLYFGAESG